MVLDVLLFPDVVDLEMPLLSKELDPADDDSVPEWSPYEALFFFPAERLELPFFDASLCPPIFASPLVPLSLPLLSSDPEPAPSDDSVEPDCEWDTSSAEEEKLDDSDPVPDLDSELESEPDVDEWEEPFPAGFVLDSLVAERVASEEEALDRVPCDSVPSEESSPCQRVI